MIAGGRGTSGDTAPYAIEREIEDLAALIHEAGGSASVFGYSSTLASSYWGDVLLIYWVVVASFYWGPSFLAWPPSLLGWHTAAGS